MRLLALSCLLLFSVEMSLAQHPNVLISTFNAPNEPSICINPKNPQQVVAGANIDNIHYSNDGGVSWTQSFVNCPWGVWGDPVISTDTNGTFLFLHLSNPPAPGNWIDRIIAQKSSNGGLTWSSGSFMGLNGAKSQDKQWVATDWKTNALYVTWTEFDVYGSFSPTDSSNILFSKSTDGGETWSPTKRINTLSGDCIDSDNTAEGAVPAVGPNGEVFVAWANRDKIWFDRSLDGGATWLATDILVSDQPGGWDYAVPGIYRCNGLPVTACDTSGSAYHGTIYINWTDQRNGEDDTDVWIAKSTDGGDTWSAPLRVNDDATNRHQFFSWLTVDQMTGWLWLVFYDRRHYMDNQTDVFMAVSKDGGATFRNFKVSETPFLPSETFFFGDYTNISAFNNMVRPIWTRLDDNELSIWTALINPDALVSNTEPTADASPVFSTENPYPNPFSEVSGFSFKLHRQATVSLSLVDMQGQVRARMIDQESRKPGKYLEKIDAKRLGIPSGTYFILLEVDGKVSGKKVSFLD